MRLFLFSIFAIAVGLGTGLIVNAATEQLYTQAATNFNRACRYVGADIQIAATNVSANSTGLLGGTAYELVCTVDTFVKEQPSGGTGSASNANRTLKANTVLKFWTKPNDFLSIATTAGTGNCNIVECQ